MTSRFNVQDGLRDISLYGRRFIPGHSIGGETITFGSPYFLLFLDQIQESTLLIAVILPVQKETRLNACLCNGMSVCLSSPSITSAFPGN